MKTIRLFVCSAYAALAFFACSDDKEESKGSFACCEDARERCFEVEAPVSLLEKLKNGTCIEVNRGKVLDRCPVKSMSDISQITEGTIDPFIDGTTKGPFPTVSYYYNYGKLSCGDN